MARCAALCLFGTRAARSVFCSNRAACMCMHASCIPAGTITQLRGLPACSAHTCRGQPERISDHPNAGAVAASRPGLPGIVAVHHASPVDDGWLLPQHAAGRLGGSAQGSGRGHWSSQRDEGEEQCAPCAMRRKCPGQAALTDAAARTRSSRPVPAQDAPDQPHKQLAHGAVPRDEQAIVPSALQAARHRRAGQRPPAAACAARRLKQGAREAQPAGPGGRVRGHPAPSKQRF